MADASRRPSSLDPLVDAIVGSYDSPLEINNLETAALPNRAAVVRGFGQLLPVLYMGFYGRPTLTRGNLRDNIARHLQAAHELLFEQLTRALRYDHWTRLECRTAPACTAEQVLHDLYAELPSLRATLNSDVQAAFDGDPAAASVEDVVFSYPSIVAVTAHRVAHVLHRRGVPLIPRILAEHAHERTGIDIHPGARIGERFFIDHGSGVVIGETTVIGNNVKLYQGVTLGALSIPHRAAPRVKRHPTLEDDVTVYAGSTILGGETVIGRGSVIGGNSWLTESVPAGTRLLGRGRLDP